MGVNLTPRALRLLPNKALILSFIGNSAHKSLKKQLKTVSNCIKRFTIQTAQVYVKNTRAQKSVEAGFDYLPEIDGVKPSENEQIDNCYILLLHGLS